MSKIDRRLGGKSRDFPVQDVHFIGEQDGRPERELKGRVTEVLRSQSNVLRAYLARVTYGDRPPVMASLCLRTQSNPDAALLERLSGVFASIFRRDQHLDILFLDDVHEAKLASRCRAFYFNTPEVDSQDAEGRQPGHAQRTVDHKDMGRIDSQDMPQPGRAQQWTGRK
jgi:hypothetical protein